MGYREDGLVRNDIRGRYQTDPDSSGGVVTRPVGDRHYDVQQYTGYATSTVSRGQWDRGYVYRFATAQVRPSGRNLYMFDRTDPSTWHAPHV